MGLNLFIPLNFIHVKRNAEIMIDIKGNSLLLKIRRGGRVVEGARLESVFTGNRNEGSNPSLSAIN